MLAPRREFGSQPADRADDAVRAALFERIATLLSDASGVDFRRYKRPTIERRVQRRIQARRLTLEGYVRFLEQDPTEIRALFEDLLILVTGFFREPESFEALRVHVIPLLFGQHADQDPVRVWSAGCSTGEEAYSLAILLLEAIEEHPGGQPAIVFATDVSEPALEKARLGAYPDSIAASVSPVGLRRFFTKTETGYRVTKTVRNLCVFARQDLTHDPPFSKLDLILCRNVLMYMGTELQREVLATLHYALRPNGFLMLGKAETIAKHSDLFDVIDGKNQLYVKRGVAPPLVVPARYSIVQPARLPKAVRLRREMRQWIDKELGRLRQRRPEMTGVLVNGDLKIIRFYGRTGAFIEAPPGEPNMNLLAMVRESLASGVRDAVNAARKTKGSICRDGLSLKLDGARREVSLEVLPLDGPSPHFLVLFHEVRRRRRKGRS